MPDEPKPIAKPAADPKERTPGESASEAFFMLNGLAQAMAEIGRSNIFDFAALTATYRRNSEAVSAASRASLQGAQSMVRCEIDMTQQMMADLNEVTRLLMSAETPLARAAHCADLLRQMSERAVANERRMCDLIRDSQREVFDLLNRRALDTMAEIKDALEKGEQRFVHG